ncbi:hypothetical protein LXL04_005418 [Taraxacum kok-saghyz]
MHDGLPNRLNLSKRGMEIQSLNCFVCNFGVESIDRSLFRCELETAKNVLFVFLKKPLLTSYVCAAQTTRRPTPFADTADINTSARPLHETDMGKTLLKSADLFFPKENVANLKTKKTVPNSVPSLFSPDRTLLNHTDRTEIVGTAPPSCSTPLIHPARRRSSHLSTPKP